MMFECVSIPPHHPGLGQLPMHVVCSVFRAAGGECSWYLAGHFLVQVFYVWLQ